MSHICGNQWKFYFNGSAIVPAGASMVDADIAGATWTEEMDIQSSSISRSRSSNPYNTRGGNFNCPGTLSKGLDAVLAVDVSDPIYDVLLNAIDTNTPIAAAEVSGDITTTGTKGLAGNFYVTEAPEDHPEEGVSTMNFSLTPVPGEVIEYTAP